MSALLRLGNAASFEKMSQLWQTVVNTVSDLTGPTFEPQAYHSRDERVTARPIGRSFKFDENACKAFFQHFGLQ